MNTTKITYNRDYNEYRVRLFVDGVYQAGADCFTDDKEDAKHTAEHMRLNGGISDKTTDFAKDEQKEYNKEISIDNEDEEIDNETILYDVCNDYSLDECTTEFKESEYKAVERNSGIVYTHKQNNEIHYYKGKAGLNGVNLFSL